MEYGVIGEKLGHSFSAQIHNMLGDYKYETLEIPPEKLDEFMKKKDFKGINVTIPYKEKVIPYLDYVDEVAKEIGAVNTIVNKDGILTGYNTDFYGLSQLIKRSKTSLKDKTVAILGSGGTAKTSYAVAKDMGAAKIIKVSRREEDDFISYKELHKREEEIQVIINTTPLGMYPNTEEMPVDPYEFSALDGIIDVVYNPLSTNLILQARGRGVGGINGLYMLVAQAAKAASLFFQDDLKEEAQDPMVNKIEEVFAKLLEEKKNIVLVGMPGSGKTTVGLELAKALNRKFIDSDEEFIKKHKMPILDYFQNYGEDKFRRKEMLIIEEISKESGVIIATGGGVILRDENINALRQNGMLIFLDRDPKDIIPTKDRPLGDTSEAVEARYLERFLIYRHVADATVKVDGDIKTVTRKVLNAFTDQLIKEAKNEDK